jgi:hypothetical protein
MAYTDFGFMRPGNGNGDEVKKPSISEGEKIAIAQNEREKMLEYMRHPSYKERLKKEMFVDSFNPNDKRNVADLEDEYATRMKEVSTIPISRGSFENIGKDFYGEYFPKTKSIIQLPRKLFPEGRKSPAYKLGTPQIVISEDSSSQDLLQNPELYGQVVAHELGHSTNRGAPGGLPIRSKNVPRTYIYKALEEHAFAPEATQRQAVSEMINPDFTYMNKGYQKRLEEIASKRIGPEKARMIAEAQHNLRKEYAELDKKYGKNYDPDIHESPKNPYIELNKIQNPRMQQYLENSPTEVSTMMIGLRKLAAEKFGHDMSQDFDIKKYKDQIQNYFNKNGMINEYEQLSRDLGLSDDQINEIMKYIARVPQQQMSQYTG